MTDVEKLIINLVEASHGMKETTLMSHLVVKFIGSDIAELENALEGLIIDGFVKEISYIIPDCAPKKFIVPKGTLYL